MLAGSFWRHRSHCIPSQLATTINLAQELTNYYWSLAANRVRHSSSDLVGIAVRERRLLHAFLRKLVPLLPDLGSDLRPSNRHLVLHLVQTANCGWSHYATVGSRYSESDNCDICFNSCRHCNYDVADCPLLLLHSRSCKEGATRRGDLFYEGAFDRANVPR